MSARPAQPAPPFEALAVPPPAEMDRPSDIGTTNAVS